MPVAWNQPLNIDVPRRVDVEARPPTDEEEADGDGNDQARPVAVSVSSKVVPGLNLNCEWGGSYVVCAGLLLLVLAVAAFLYLNQPELFTALLGIATGNNTEINVTINDLD